MTPLAPHVPEAPPAARLRPAASVMRLDRLGAAFPTRLSFMPSLLRTLKAERVQVRRPVWQVDGEGYGRAVYSLDLRGRPVSLVAFASPLPDHARTDRVIADAWDTTYALYDGVPDTAALDRLQAQVPRQEAGRFDATELVLSRANKSVRLCGQVVDALAVGRQPDAATVASIGYLMRTTAVYGNGKFGIADRGHVAGLPGLDGPFRAELLAVWLIREFTCDLVEHIAAARAPDTAARLEPAIRRMIGIGNSTGLGMAPFLIAHPLLLDAWMTARETALARVRALPAATAGTWAAFGAALARARAHVEAWAVDDPIELLRLGRLRDDLATLAERVDRRGVPGPFPWDRLIRASTDQPFDLQELLVALVLAPHGHLVDDLCGAMATESEPALDPAMRCGVLREMLERHFGWALDIDFDDPDQTARFWYVSEEKQEPRLGECGRDHGVECALPLDIARQAATLWETLDGASPAEPVAVLVLRRPDLRHVVRRVQAAPDHPYAEIRANLIAGDVRPVDILRPKLAMFGACRFDPRSDRWLRVTLYQGAPTAAEIATADPDTWLLAAPAGP